MGWMFFFGQDAKSREKLLIWYCNGKRKESYVKMQFVTLSTDSFAVRGLQTNQNTGVKFLGLKYATAKRWEYPIPVALPTNSTTVMESSEIGHACPQICRNVNAFCPVKISEDCLFLNVFTPFNSTNTSKLKVPSNRPVLVYIHGGTFLTVFDPG
jgi:carboxylesterase type B